VPSRLRGTEKLVNIAFEVPYTHASFRLAEQTNRTVIVLERNLGRVVREQDPVVITPAGSIQPMSGPAACGARDLQARRAMPAQAGATHAAPHARAIASLTSTNGPSATVGGHEAHLNGPPCRCRS
jgi:hypothetical protein